MIRLAPELSLPVEAATQTFLVVGKRGSGKSNTAVRFAEQLDHAGIPWVAIDPVDNWYGVKSSRDGKGPGLSVYVFGGPHGDLPLESTAGALVADTIVEHRITAVLSVKHFSGRERGRFVADFAQRLFQRNTEPLHVFLEEAHEVAPQQPYKGEEEMLGHVARIWKLGRSSGLGGSAVTQRPASLSKNITTQAEILVVHRTLGPQDVAAIREWIKYHGEREDILSQLATLKTGEAFIWAPDFPEGRPIGLQRVMVHQRETFDSAATPKAGEKRVEPKTLATVDLEKLAAKMAATIEKAKAEDPRELRRLLAEATKRVATLEHNLARRPETVAAVKTVEKRILKDRDHRQLEVAIQAARVQADRFERLTKPLQDATEAVLGVAADFTTRANALETMVRDALTPAPPPAAVGISHRPVGVFPMPPRATPVHQVGEFGDADVDVGSGGLRRMMVALAQRPGLTLRQLGVRAGLSSQSGTFSTYLSRGRQRGWITGGPGQRRSVSRRGSVTRHRWRSRKGPR